jgi:hypothetical protein
MIVLGAVIALGCGAPDKPKGSCDTRDKNTVCEEFTGPASEIATYKTICTNTMGKWKDALCDHTNSVGGCLTIDNSLNLMVTNWFFLPTTADDVMQSCMNPSLFVKP